MNIDNPSKKKRSKLRRAITGISFIIFIVIPIIWFFSVRSDYYKKIQQEPPLKEASQPQPK